VKQRGRGWAKRTTQASQTGCAGQEWQTAHWPGVAAFSLSIQSRSIGSIYSSHLSVLPMATERPPTIDPVAAARWERAAPPHSPWLHEEVGRRMEDRLQWIRLKPAAWADWEPVRGGLKAHALVEARYPEAQCFVGAAHPETTREALKAFARPWWRRLGTPAAQVGALPDGQAQMLWANMALHATADPQALIAQWHRALAPMSSPTCTTGATCSWRPASPSR
jgi:hypothetical protein